MFSKVGNYSNRTCQGVSGRGESYTLHDAKFINLVDPASSHMLVLKIKPCKYQYKLFGDTANGSLKQLSFIWRSIVTWITMVILRLSLIHI